MIDIHCHILPGIDDGSPDLETSIGMASIAAADGIQTIIATPHVGADGVLDMARITDAVCLLNSALQQENIALDILPGAEVQSHAAVAVAEQYTLAGSSFFLLEFPHSHLPADAVDLIYDFVGRGLTPIIAHPERNHAISAQPDTIIALVEAGARVQVTSGSLTGEQGPDARGCARYLLKKNMVHFLATDSHSPSFRKPVLSKAVKSAGKFIGKAEALALVTSNPQEIISQSSVGR